MKTVSDLISESENQKVKIAVPSRTEDDAMVEVLFIGDLYSVPEKIRQMKVTETGYSIKEDCAYITVQKMQTSCV